MAVGNQDLKVNVDSFLFQRISCIFLASPCPPLSQGYVEFTQELIAGELAQKLYFITQKIHKRGTNANQVGRFSSYCK